MKSRIEMNDCTFKPKLVSTQLKDMSPPGSRQRSGDPFEKLYNDQELRQEKIAKKEAFQYELLKKECTFSPERLTKKKDNFFIRS